MTPPCPAILPVTVPIRPLGSGDAVALMALYNQRGPAARRTFRALGGDTCDLARCEQVIAAATASPPRGLDLVATEGMHLVGWGFVWNLAEAQPLFGLLVADNHQGRGLGRRLTEAVLAGTDALGLPAVHLTVVEDNLPAIGLYARLGFVDTGGFVHDDGLPYRRMVRRRP